MIIVRSPLRISLAGGGTDLNGFYSNEMGAVCSLAINKYVYVTINNLSTYFPHRFRIAYSQTELTQDVSSVKHPIVREALMAMKIHGGIDINVMSDIPAGTGLGSSSTFTVSLLHALNAFQNQLVSKDYLAREACRLEIDVLKEPIGKQDQFAAAFGGINLFKFYKSEQVSVEPLPISEETEQTLMRRLMVFYLGGNRSASNILKEQSANTATRIDELKEMREQAIAMAAVLANGHNSSIDEVGKILHRGWTLKKKLAAGISNSEIDVAVNRALEAGALGGKLLGAGGTGFLLFYVPDDRQNAVRASLAPLQEVHFNLDRLGSTLLYFER